MESTDLLINNELHIDSTCHNYLSETARWSNFLAIVGFVFSGIIAIVAFFIGTIFSRLTNGYNTGGAFIGGGFITAMYLLIAVFNFFVSLFLYRFSSKMKVALYSNDQSSLNDSFFNLKRLYKMFGILTIIYLSFIALAIIGTMFAAIRR